MSPSPAPLTVSEWTALLGVSPAEGWPGQLAGVQPDSRRVRSGEIFVAIAGTEGDGHHFAQDALRRGAAGVVADHPLALPLPVTVVPDPRKVLVRLSRHFYGLPDQKLRLCGVTGTNGKTSVVGFMRQLLEGSGHCCGQLGTVSYRFGEREIPARRTTPGAPELHEYLKAMVDAGCSDAVMEVSSHALDQQRVAELSFDAAVFTNLSQDHLDYHQDMESYFQAKAALFRFPSLELRIAGDDPWSRRLAAECGGQVLLCGLDEDCDVRARLLANNLEGLRAEVRSPWGSGELRLTQPGEHNLRNALQALAVVAGYGLDFQETLARIPELTAAPGRLQPIPCSCGKVLVDYAHTPDALAHVVELLKALTPGKLVVVFGCGGDRDRTKRPLMVQVCTAADEMIFTNDNPRTEDPEQIFADMKTGLSASSSYRVIADRRQAIAAGIAMIGEGDVLLIAGKGHETVQETGSTCCPFDDRVVAAELITQKESLDAGV